MSSSSNAAYYPGKRPRSKENESANESANNPSKIQPGVGTIDKYNALINETVKLAKQNHSGIPYIERLANDHSVLGVDFNTVVFIKENGVPITLEEIFGMAAADPKSPFYTGYITKTTLTQLQYDIKDTIRNTAISIFKDTPQLTDNDIISTILMAVSISFNHASRQNPINPDKQYKALTEDPSAEDPDDGLGGGGKRRNYKQHGGNWFTDAFTTSLNLTMTVISFSWVVIKYPFVAGGNRIARLKTTQAIIQTFNDPSNNFIDNIDTYIAGKIPLIPGLAADAAMAGYTKIGDYLGNLDAYDWTLFFLIGIYTYGGTPFLINGLTWAISFLPGGLLPGFLGEGLIVKTIDVLLTYKVSQYGFKVLKFIVQKGVNGGVVIYRAGDEIIKAVKDRIVGATEAELQTAGRALDTRLQAMLRSIRGQDGLMIGEQIPIVAGAITDAANLGALPGEQPAAARVRRDGNIRSYLRARPSSVGRQSINPDGSNAQGGDGGGNNNNGSSGNRVGGGRRTRRKHKSRRNSRHVHRKSCKHRRSRQRR